MPPSQPAMRYAIPACLVPPRGRSRWHPPPEPTPQSPHHERRESRPRAPHHDPLLSRARETLALGELASDSLESPKNTSLVIVAPAPLAGGCGF
ncbi:hypothetical protein GQ55_5G118000 [Panicum hallii var. hallii]|uniref:Uncharacterized protein n=1 Tax=Panicum hallii var. hallii TaxID=1504633 RepID=A0A2T7DFB4_9POAL|nr:hypothetical protein GQ55_5G118000 [Panicum hallii var. hallii]